jgi:hypothetical protein
MPTEEELYWEKEYNDYEARFGSNEVFWRTPAYALKGSPLFEVFERFCETFPDHPHEYNTVFYLFDYVSVSPKSYSILFRCAHFEHNTFDDLRALIDYLAFAATRITGSNNTDFVGLDLLDGYGEKLHITFDHPSNEIISILKKHSTRSATK